MKQKSREYEGQGIVVEFELPRCIHARECVRGLPEVFDIEARPWIRPGSSSAEAIAEVIHRCPTGALRYRRTDGGPSERPSDVNSVRVVPDGPLHLRGTIRLQLPDGEVIEQTRVALCRCGDSKNKPFCDNTHLETEFAEPGLALEHRLGSWSDESGDTLKVKLAANGPILIEGGLEVISADGAAQGGRGALCRCGASQVKPYCDGSHKAAGFEAD